MGFVPTLADPNGLTVHRRNHWAILSIKIYNQAVFLYVHFKMTNFHFLPILQFSIIKNYFTWSCQDFFIVVVIMTANDSKCPRFEPGHNHLVIFFYIVISNRQINMQ